MIKCSTHPQDVRVIDGPSVPGIAVTVFDDELPGCFRVVVPDKYRREITECLGLIDNHGSIPRDSTLR